MNVTPTGSFLVARARRVSRPERPPYEAMGVCSVLAAAPAGLGMALGSPGMALGAAGAMLLGSVYAKSLNAGKPWLFGLQLAAASLVCGAAGAFGGLPGLAVATLAGAGLGYYFGRGQA